MVTHEDPLSDEVPFAEGYARAKQKAQELDGYASLFGEMPSSVTPAKGREILNQEGFEYRDSFDQVEQYHDAWGIVATLRDYGREAIIVFHLQTIFAACPLLPSQWGHRVQILHHGPARCSNHDPHGATLCSPAVEGALF